MLRVIGADIPVRTTGRCPNGDERLGVGGDIGDQLVQFGVGLGLEAATIALRELVGVQAASYVLTAKYVTDDIAIGIGSSQATVLWVAL
jgi:hypothetical protein